MTPILLKKWRAIAAFGSSLVNDAQALSLAIRHKHIIIRNKNKSVLISIFRKDDQMPGRRTFPSNAQMGCTPPQAHSSHHLLQKSVHLVSWDCVWTGVLDAPHYHTIHTKSMTQPTKTSPKTSPKVVIHEGSSSRTRRTRSSRWT